MRKNEQKKIKTNKKVFHNLSDSRWRLVKDKKGMKIMTVVIRYFEEMMAKSWWQILFLWCWRRWWWYGHDFSVTVEHWSDNIVLAVVASKRELFFRCPQRSGFRSCTTQCFLVSMWVLVFSVRFAWRGLNLNHVGIHMYPGSVAPDCGGVYVFVYVNLWMCYDDDYDYYMYNGKIEKTWGIDFFSGKNLSFW